MIATMTFRLLLSFCLLTYNTGLSDEISVFVQSGASVQLDIQTQQLPPKLEYLDWLNEKLETIVRHNLEFKITKNYTAYNDRMFYNETTFSLTLKNIQKTDSGRYTARAAGEKSKDYKYKVSVIDEVDAPVLTVNSNWSDSELCSFTCSGRDINISSTYNSSSCSEEEVTSADNHTIRLNCNATFIMCNYSNPVSWKSKVHELCNVSTERRTSTKPTVFPLGLIAVVFLVALGLLVAISFSFYKRRKDYPVAAQMNIQKLYSNVDGEGGDFCLQENKKPQTSPEKTENPLTIYHTLGEQTDLPIKTNHTTPDNTNNPKSSGSVTIYSTIEKQPDQPKSETENTIYSMVKKPLPGYESPKLD